MIWINSEFVAKSESLLHSRLSSYSDSFSINLVIIRNNTSLLLFCYRFNRLWNSCHWMLQHSDLPKTWHYYIICDGFSFCGHSSRSLRKIFYNISQTSCTRTRLQFWATRLITSAFKIITDHLNNWIPFTS